MKLDWNSIVDKDWTLFLDRDGVINRRVIGGYVTSWDQFEFLPGVLDAIQILSSRFKYIFLITNQQGVGKGLMSMEELDLIHDKMCCFIENHGGCIDCILACPQLADDPDNYRKPKPDMAFMAQEICPDINLHKTVMVGDGITDVQFGKNAGTYTVFIGDENADADDSFNSLAEFASCFH